MVLRAQTLALAVQLSLSRFAPRRRQGLGLLREAQVPHDDLSVPLVALHLVARLDSADDAVEDAKLILGLLEVALDFPFELLEEGLLEPLGVGQLRHREEVVAVDAQANVSALVREQARIRGPTDESQAKKRGAVRSFQPCAASRVPYMHLINLPTVPLGMPASRGISTYTSRPIRALK